MNKSSAKAKARPSPVKAAVAKKAAKPVKAAAKKAVKVAPKAAVKAAVKTVAKVALKKPAQSLVKANPAVKKAQAKPLAKAPAKKALKTPVKLPPKVQGKAAVKPVAKPVVKTTPVKAPSKAPVKTPNKAAAAASVKAPSLAPIKAPANAPTAHKAQVTPTPKPVLQKSHENHLPVVAGQSIAQPQSKKSSRGAKAASMVPPPPVAVVSSNAAKSSYGPSTTPSLPSVIPVTPKKDSKLANNWKKKPVGELSDAEILSMPDTEYMNDTQMAFFRLKLVVLKGDILANAGQTTENLREETVVVPDPADRATIEEEHALELRTRDRERKLLKKIEQSIHRIDGGDYGYCDETGEAIGVGRLLARPTATLSLEAQQRRELKQKMFGD
jgi:DnaK suppressor protein